MHKDHENTFKINKTISRFYDKQTKKGQGIFQYVSLVIEIKANQN